MDSRPEHAPMLEAVDSRCVLRPWADPEPLIVEEAHGCTIIDVHGKAYLDFTAGYFVQAAGHSHPRIVAAATAQLARVTQVSGRNAAPAAVRLAERLVALAPVRDGKVLYATGGSEANEQALRVVRQHAGTSRVACLENAYHGLTLGALELAGNAAYRASAGRPLGDHAVRLPNAYCYRCPYGPAERCHTECLDSAEDALHAAAPVGALVAEPIQSVGGLAPPLKWWERLDRLRRARGLLLVLDEVQTGLGRTGRMFAAEHYGLEADVLTAGKGLSGGVGSMAAAVVTDRVGRAFEGATTATSAGNAVSAAAGLALLDVLAEDDLPARAARAGAVLGEALRRLADPWIGDIRLVGLLGGVELVRDREHRAPLDAATMTRVRRALQDDGVLVTRSGPHGNVIRLQPPLIVTDEEIEHCVGAVGRALRRVRGGDA